MFKYLKSYASLLGKLFGDSMRYSFVDLKTKQNKTKNTDLTNTQHATGKAAVKTFKVLLHSTRACEAIRWAKVDVVLQEIKRSAILGRKWEIHSKPLQPRA